ncbi:MAG TPA: S-adenosylmethionine decarboxylase [Polyangiaceae bacterium]|nr:S-adenosylmethionine decarboxylase [Polyangiaceae bacterium]
MKHESLARVSRPYAVQRGSRAWSLATADLEGAPLDAVDGDVIARSLERTLTACIGPIAWGVHRFEPRGASLVGVAPRGRVIVHTWPEHAALTVDLYAEHARAEAALAASADALMAELTRVQSRCGRAG